MPTAVNRAAVIVAGGQGSRMQSDIPKQFLLLAGKPLLIHTLEAFYQYNTSLPIWLVLPEAEHTRWENLCREYQCTVPHQVVVGGACRPQSVKNGISQIQFEEGVVAIHDGVRPLVSHRVIQESFGVAEKNGSAIASVPLKDSLRKMRGEESVAQNRAAFRLMQTPQAFRLSWLLEAYEKLDVIDDFSDEASMVEAAGRRVTLFDGDYRNIKVTTPEDMLVVEAFHRSKASE
ncbi:2-C-methyl-D-erythritol 4-phosphate cytidylyltransferase [Tunicatimonas pelagia]|uniref:2-C-methyl-D-erythritol 4-phosphate cytidylyltransferase n=1 Tax=Tunicatimonas pelagia TaxID=931531 RepID=UPI002666D869|nr:2-C-methyl-D-erythritol 4-phosphate cytidylyltransferase [Tunicatimonas pelagia]WKN42836.1 2-C-methyl-D-erythritol 4-phosphate cytidylyltransferase [Tunicatimonas pelagia]